MAPARYFSSAFPSGHACNRFAKDEAAVGFYLVLVNLSCTTGENSHLSFFFVFGLFENRKQCLLLLHSLFLRIVICVVSNNRGPTVFVLATENYF